MKTALISFVLAAALALPGSVDAAEPAHPTGAVPDIRAEDLAARVKAISDDAFQGRGPGTMAGERAAGWIASEMQRIGLKPGNGTSYFQQVPAESIALDAAR